MFSALAHFKSKKPTEPSLAKGNPKALSGFSLIELLVTIALGGVLLAGLVVLYAQFLQWPRNISAGETMIHVRKEAERFITDDFQTAYTGAAGGPYVVTVADLDDAGYLDGGRVQGAGAARQVRNSLNQTHAVLLRQVGTNFKSMVVTNGQAAQPSQVLAAASLDPRGGRVVNDATYCAGISNPCIRGNFDAWRIDLDDWDNAATNAFLPAVGNFVSVTHYGSNGEILEPFLYRSDIGNPAANTMNTDIDMGGNSILNVEDVCLSSTGECLAGGIGLRGSVPHNALVAQPTCPANNPVPKIITSLQIFTDDGDNHPVSSGAVIATPEGSNWRITIQVLTQDGWETPPSGVGRATVQTFCAAA